MTADVMQELTLQLPVDLVARLVQIANRRHQSVEQVVAEVLDVSLPSLNVRATAEMQSQIRKLQTQSREALRASANSNLSDEYQERLSELLARNRSSKLTDAETVELEALLDKVELTAVQKAAAHWLLTHPQNQVE